jgi:hypothetical protein
MLVESNVPQHRWRRACKGHLLRQAFAVFHQFKGFSGISANQEDDRAYRAVPIPAGGGPQVMGVLGKR